MQTIAVLPTYNEKDNLPLVIDQLLKQSRDLHICVVDDGSPDGTGQIADSISGQFPDRVFVIHRDVKDGLGKAYVTGFQSVLSRHYDAVIQMDSDLSHDPADVPRFLSALETNDLVLGSRYVERGLLVEMTAWRRALSRFGSRYSAALLGLPVEDLTSGYKCWRSDTLAAVIQTPVRSTGYLFQVEMTLRAYLAGARVKEIPIHFRKRNSGTSKMTGSIIAEAASGVLRLRSQRKSIRREIQREERVSLR